MIKVYNKQSKYLRVSGKIIAPFKTEDFEERNQQIRILERNGIVVVTDVLSENTTPTQSNIIENNNNGEDSVVLTEQPEISEETSNEAETEVEVKEDNLSDEKTKEPVEESEEPKTKETEKVQEKKAKRIKKSKKEVINNAKN